MRLASLSLACTFVFACATPASPVDDPEQGSYEGVEFDAENPGAPLDDDKSDAPRYKIPTDLPDLVAPEIIVSLNGLTVHLFDRETGFQAVYPAGVGVKVDGVSITPTGHFATGSDTADSWWYVSRRTAPEYFGGFPFLRLTAENSEGSNTYALHGPITETLQRGYVSHGCVRMRGDDIVRLFWMVKIHADTPVTIQREVERDAAGNRVDVGRTPVLWGVGEEIRYGASVGPRP
jgi:lipoprotein-anchoring transpeptidase ErfK/SrfK